jgi:hypothetical protein
MFWKWLEALVIIGVIMAAVIIGGGGLITFLGWLVRLAYRRLRRLRGHLPTRTAMLPSARIAPEVSDAEPTDWEEVLWNLEAFKREVLIIRDAALNQDNFTESQLQVLADMACGFANSFTIIKAIELIKEVKEVK